MHTSEGRGYLRLPLAGAAAVLVWLVSCGADAAAQTESIPPSVSAVTVAAPPVVDGALDDPCWQQATHIDGFWREQVDAPELERTEAWLCRDSTAVYVAFRCHDSRPSEIRAGQRKRQGDIHLDDSVGILLDVEDKGTSFYEFSVTPAGTQNDAVPGGTSEKIEWRGDWQAAARRDERGWTAEMAIPFSVLRYPEGQQRFRFLLTRRLARERDQSAWPACWARRQDGSQCARWTGLMLPKRPFSYVLMPYLLSVASKDEGEDEKWLTGGLDVKGTFPNGAVALATYQPDFRNIEDVVESIDFTFVERRLPEYRPFFREGEGYGPPRELFYSRRVKEFDWGAKTFGTVGSHRFSLLDAWRSGGENHLVWNYQRLFGTEGHLAFSGADRAVPGEPDNAAHGVGTYWSRTFAGGDRWVSGDWYGSRTEGDGGDGGAVNVAAGMSRTQGFGWSAEYDSVESDFRADDGYVPETGVRQNSLRLSYDRSYDEGALQDQMVSASYRTGTSPDGDRRNFYAAWSPSLRNGLGAWIEGSLGERDGFDVKSAFIGPSWNAKDAYHKGNIGYEWGERYGQPSRYWRFNQAFRPTQRWSAEINASGLYAASLDDGNVLPPEWVRQLVVTTTFDISTERTVSARLVRQDGHTNMYAAYRQRVRTGMDLLVVVGDPNAEEWVSRLAVKAIWCF